MLSLRLAALNIDGVLLNDTFSPVIHQFVVSRGGTYSAALERSVFSQSQHIAGQRLAAAVGGGMTGEAALAADFEERAAHVGRHPVTITPGTHRLLLRLRTRACTRSATEAWARSASTAIWAATPTCSTAPATSAPTTSAPVSGR
ncbi:hypothetical protein SBADM41S_12015 [Streptomyces badius]